MSDSSAVTVTARPRAERSRRVREFPEPIWKWGMALVICLQIAFLVLINAFPEWIGVVTTLDESGRFVPLVGPGFYRALPWINAAVGASLALCLIHLALGHSTPATRWADLAVSAFGCWVLFLLTTTHSLLAPGVDQELLGPGSLIGPLTVGRFGRTVYVGFFTAAAYAGLWVAFWISALGVTIKAVRLTLHTLREWGF